MQDRIDPSTWPSKRGPWPEVTDSSRMLDRGAAWCLHAAGHPHGDQEYPDSDIHFPFDECITASFYLEDTAADLNGPPLDLAIYGARPFQFGRLRGIPGAGRGRVVFDLCELESGNGRIRFSVGQGEGLLLARQLTHLIDQLNMVRR